MGTGALLWWRIQGFVISELWKLVRRPSINIKKTNDNNGFAERVHNMHAPSLQGLFEVGGACARAILQATTGFAGTDETFMEFPWPLGARTELYRCMQPHAWMCKEVP